MWSFLKRLFFGRRLPEMEVRLSSDPGWDDQVALRGDWVAAMEKFMATIEDPKVRDQVAEIHRQDCERWDRVVRAHSAG